MTAESGFKETVEPEDVVFESVVHLLTRATAHRLKAPPEPEGDATPTPKPSNTKPQIRHHGPPPPGQENHEAEDLQATATARWD